MRRQQREKIRDEASLILGGSHEASDHVAGSAHAGLETPPRHFHNQQIGVRRESGGIRQTRIDQCHVTRAQRDLATVLLNQQCAGELTADEQLVGDDLHLPGCVHRGKR